MATHTFLWGQAQHFQIHSLYLPRNEWFFSLKQLKLSALLLALPLYIFHRPGYESNCWSWFEFLPCLWLFSLKSSEASLALAPHPTWVEPNGNAAEPAGLSHEDGTLQWSPVKSSSCESKKHQKLHLLKRNHKHLTEILKPLTWFHIKTRNSDIIRKGKQSIKHHKLAKKYVIVVKNNYLQ